MFGLNPLDRLILVLSTNIIAIVFNLLYTYLFLYTGYNSRTVGNPVANILEHIHTSLSFTYL